MNSLVKRYFIHDEAGQCFLVMQCIGDDYLIKVKLRECNEIYALHNDNSSLYKWCLKLGLLETLEVLVGENIQPRIEMSR